MNINQRNAIFHWLQSYDNNKQKMVVKNEIMSRDSLDYLRKAQVTYIIILCILVVAQGRP